ncbi:MAG TPA: hypothetical protein VJA22_01385 [Patescibacteria group bacterium]|nr:hypothetical protein [Patescibacteria group bacterium]
MKTKIIISMIFFAVLFMFPALTFAQDFFISDPLNISDDSNAATESGADTVQVLVVNVIQYTLALVGVLSFAIFVYAGITWMLAGGNDSIVDKSKKMMFWAIIGLIITFSSYAILRTVFETFTDSFGVTEST